jgi:predicted ATPase
MSALESLGIPSTRPKRETVSIIVGPNGSGKSNFLKELASEIRQHRNVAIVCNTTYDRFKGMTGVKRLSASRSNASPESIIKRTVSQTVDSADSRFYQIGSILEYCDYRPRFGFQIRADFQQIRDIRPDFSSELEAAIDFLKSHDLRQIIWIDPRDSALNFSRARDFANVLRKERALRKAGLDLRIQVYLETEDGITIELSHASSGELALISSLVFLITFARPDPVILIDEPENSLHPGWQREYVDRILTAMSYRAATIVIASHAPLIVTGALSKHPNSVSIFQIQGGKPLKLSLGDSKVQTGGIEEVLWRAFDVITPANHFVSEELVEVVSQVERGEIDKNAALVIVDTMDEKSFDGRQRAFFSAVKELIEEADLTRQGTPRDG